MRMRIAALDPQGTTAVDPLKIPTEIQVTSPISVHLSGEMKTTPINLDNIEIMHQLKQRGETTSDHQNMNHPLDILRLLLAKAHLLAKSHRYTVLHLLFATVHLSDHHQHAVKPHRGAAMQPTTLMSISPSSVTNHQMMTTLTRCITARIARKNSKTRLSVTSTKTSYMVLVGKNVNMDGVLS